MSYGTGMSSDQQQQQYAPPPESRATTVLRDAVRVNEESQLIGQNTMSSMVGQREQLENSHRQVEETREMTREAHKKLNDLQRRLRIEQLTLTGMVVALAVIDCLLIYRLATNHGKL